jgi:hypothetical protein
MIKNETELGDPITGTISNNIIQNCLHFLMRKILEIVCERARTKIELWPS